MFATYSIPMLLSAAAVMASTHQARSHNNAAKRINDQVFTFGKRDQFVNKEMTWYPTDTGPDACTGKNHLDSDYYVAMGYDQFGDGSGCCGRKLQITANGKTATATCVDECATCPQYGQIDLTKGLFQYFTNGDLDVGVIYGSWSYVDGNDAPPPPPATTTTHHTTTSTTHTTSSSTKEAPTTSSTKEAPTTSSTKEAPTPSSTKEAAPPAEKTTTHPPAEVTTSTAHTTTPQTTHTPATSSAAPESTDDGEDDCDDEDDEDNGNGDDGNADDDEEDCDDEGDDEPSSTHVAPTTHATPTSTHVVPTVTPTSIKVVPTTTALVVKPPPAPSSVKVLPSSVKVLPSDIPKPVSSAAKPSAPAVHPSSVAVVKSSASISTPAVIYTPTISTPAIETPVGNVATDPVADTESTSVPQAINGGLGEGTGGAASLGASKLLGAVVVVAVAAVQALL